MSNKITALAIQAHYNSLEEQERLQYLEDLMAKKWTVSQVRLYLDMTDIEKFKMLEDGFENILGVYLENAKENKNI